MADRAFRVVESHLSKANIAKLVEILKVPRLTLVNHLEDFPIDEDIRTLIETQITLYATYTDDQIDILPTESNFGSRRTATDNAREISNKIVALLELDPNLVPGYGNKLQRC